MSKWADTSVTRSLALVIYLLRLQVSFAQQGPQWAGNVAPLPDNEQIPGCTRVSDGNHYDVRNVQVRNEGWLNRNRFFIRCQGESFHKTICSVNGTQTATEAAILAAQLNDPL